MVKLKLNPESQILEFASSMTSGKTLVIILHKKQSFSISKKI